MAKQSHPVPRRVPDWLHHELLNWSRWCWLGPLPHPLPPDRCGSIECEYTRYRISEYGSDAPRILPNERNAERVDAIWRSLPAWPKQVLRAEYPQYQESGRAEFGRVGAARRLGLRLVDYEAALVVAIGRVADAFGGPR